MYVCMSVCLSALPVGSRGRALVGGLQDKLNRSWSSLQTLFTNFDCRNDQNLKISHNSPPDFWPVCFTVKAKRQFGGLAPKPISGAATPMTANHVRPIVYFTWPGYERELMSNNLGYTSPLMFSVAALLRNNLRQAIYRRGCKDASLWFYSNMSNAMYFTFLLSYSYSYKPVNAVCLCVCLSHINQGDTSRNRCTQRLVIFARTDPTSKLWSQTNNYSCFLGRNRPSRKWAWVGIFKPAEYACLCFDWPVTSIMPTNLPQPPSSHGIYTDTVLNFSFNNSL